MRGAETVGHLVCPSCGEPIPSTLPSPYCAWCGYDIQSRLQLILVMDTVLEDDPSSATGGISYPGETVRDFIYTVDRDLEYIKTVADLNKALKDNGIKTISEK